MGKIIMWLIFAGILAFVAWNNWDFLTKVTFEFGNGQQQTLEKDLQKQGHKVKDVVGEEETPSVYVTIKDVRLSPIATKLPSYFYFKFEFGSNIPDGAVVNLDLGKAQLQDVEVVGGCNVLEIEGKGASFARVKLNDFSRDTPIHLYCQLTAPTFQKITIDYGGSYTKELSYERYVDDFEGADVGPGLGFYTIIWRIVFVILVIIAIVMFIGLISSAIQKFS